MVAFWMIRMRQGKPMRTAVKIAVKRAVNFVVKIVVAVLTLSLAASALAQTENRYGSWQKNSPQGQSDLLKELDGLVVEAEQARAADPRFLRDLRELIRRHSNAWPVALIYDDFADGDFTANPAWSVTSGYFRILRGGGLHSNANYQSRNQEPRRKEDSRDAAVRLLGQLLLGNKGGRSRQEQRQEQEQEQAGGPGEIYLAKTISNAFSIGAEISGGGEAGFELGVYQGRDRTQGYRLIYTPKDGLLLLRLSSRGTAVVDRAMPKVNLLDGKVRTVAWRRRPDGVMTLAVDGLSLFEATDRGFRDPFDGFHLFNRGGELTLRLITIDGTR